MVVGEQSPTHQQQHQQQKQHPLQTGALTRITTTAGSCSFGNRQLQICPPATNPYYQRQKNINLQQPQHQQQTPLYHSKPHRRNSTINSLGTGLEAIDKKIVPGGLISNTININPNQNINHSGYHCNNGGGSGNNNRTSAGNKIALNPGSLVTAPAAVVSTNSGHSHSISQGSSNSKNNNNNEKCPNELQQASNVVNNNNNTNNTSIFPSSLSNIGGLGISNNSIISCIGLSSGIDCSVAGTSSIVSATTAATKNQLEQLNTMREALFSQDGWGCQHVNQDTNWEVPSSPEPTNKDPSGAPVMWKPTINNGTDLWESNLRNGGQPTQQQQQVQKTPWGHTPSSNLGGTWGEDDDGTDSSNVWTGPAGNVPVGGGVPVVGAGPGNGGGGPGVSNGPQWGQNAVGGVSAGGGPSVGGGLGGVVSNNSSVSNISGGGSGGNAVGSAGNGWCDPRDIRTGAMGGGAGGPMDIRSVESIRAASAGDPRDLRIIDQRDPIRGDPRGISGRLNGTSEMWGQHHHSVPAHNPMQSIGKIVGPGNGSGVSGGAVTSVGIASGPPVAVGGVTSLGPGGMNAAAVAAVAAAGSGPVSGGGGNVATQWGSSSAAQSVVGPKDITSMAAVSGKQVMNTGWEEPSPPPQRRNIPNYDDGTSLWGQQSRVPGGGSHWKDIPDPMNRHLMRTSLGGLNAPNCAGGGQTVALIAGQQAVGIGTPGTGPAGNSMSGVGPQGRLTAVSGGPGGGSGLGQHKQDNTAMWVHPSSNVIVGRNAGAVGGSWGTADDGSTHTVIGGGVANSASGWTTNVDEKSNVVGTGSVLGAGGVGTGSNSWNDATASWSKNQPKIPSAANVSGWGPAAAAAGVSGSGPNDGNDLGNDWSSGNHGSLIGGKQAKIGGTGCLVGIGSLNTDIIKQSKQYRILVDSGFKKDDVERALLNTNMSLDEAAELLRNNASSMVMDTWRRHDDAALAGSYVDHTNSSTGGGFNARYSTSAAAAAAQQTMSFPPNNFLNSMGGGGVGVGAGGQNPNLAVHNSLQQKYLSQQGPHGVGSVIAGPQVTVAAAFGQNSPNVTAASANSNQPSAHQLRMLVQQIQLAVQSGYLSSQILNQPLAPTTLLLLNQLLTNIKHLQGAQQSMGGRGGNANNVQITIAKYKQQITTLQNQINTQQAIYIKQQQQQNLQQQQQQQSSQQQLQNSAVSVAAAPHSNASGADYLRGHDAISGLQGNFNEISLNKGSSYQSSTQQQSRLNQWKLPVLDKELSSVDGGGPGPSGCGPTSSGATDFARAPGTTKQSLTASAVQQGNNLGGPLGLQTDCTWSSGRSIADGWPDSSGVGANSVSGVGGNSASSGAANAAGNVVAGGNDNENKDWSVQEFEPGKPWKGSQMKNIEDDPSITPGSVARSPLSINPTPKEADIFSNASKPSPTDLPPLSLTSSTWSFNPSASNQKFPSWSDNTQQCTTSELWAAPPSRPPPGLVVGGGSGGVGAKSMVINSNMVLNSTGANGWISSAGRGPGNTNVSGGNNWSPGSTGGNVNTSWNSNWLLLKNLTAQIDGATLRTLCMQHGPPITFHLYLNQGIALCKYATREEANKAQMTLNNCVLGNTTICAESPSDCDVQNILQHLPQIQQHNQTHIQQQPTPTSSNANVNSGSIINNMANGGNSAGNSGGNNCVGSSNNSGGNNILNGNANSNAASNNGNSSGSVAQNQSTSGSTSAANNGANAPVATSHANSAASTGVSGSSAASAGNWRQTSSQQQQPRPSGREAADFDYISKFVCSIVDD